MKVRLRKQVTEGSKPTSKTRPTMADADNLPDFGQETCTRERAEQLGVKFTGRNATVPELHVRI